MRKKEGVVKEGPCDKRKEWKKKNTGRPCSQAANFGRACAIRHRDAARLAKPRVSGRRARHKSQSPRRVRLAHTKVRRVIVLSLCWFYFILRMMIHEIELLRKTMLGLLLTGSAAKHSKLRAIQRRTSRAMSSSTVTS